MYADITRDWLIYIRVYLCPSVVFNFLIVTKNRRTTISNMPNDNTQREFALQVLQQLRDAGYEALWAGGCVRDQLLGRTPQDYDVATSARPEEVQALFGKRRTLAIGAAFGVIAVLGRHKQPPIEVATFRSDGAYVDGRRPAKVVYTTAEEDAERRDFTINGLFYDPIEQQVIDYVEGQQDLQRHRIRAIGDPLARFSEDKLRMLRAVRFATTLGFQIDDPTLDAIHQMAAEVNIVSAERLGAELRRMLVHPQRSSGVQLLQDSGLLQPLFPELANWPEQQPATWQRLLDRLKRLQSESLAAALAALLFDLEQKNNVGEIGRRFRFTNKEIERAAWLVQMLPSIEHAHELAWPRLQRLLVHQGSNELMVIADATWGNDHAGVKECRRRLAMPAEELNPEPLLTGDDLIRHGVTPSPLFGQLLDSIRDEQLLGHLRDRQQAQKFADQWLQDHGDR